MDPVDQRARAVTRDEALSRVLAYRERGRSRPTVVRVSLAVLAGALLIASIPLIVLLPELGIPALLVAFRLLAVEADWAARAYAWTDWRFTQARAWLHRQSGFVQAAVIGGLLLAAAALVWLVVDELV
ncbi:hypothetical protein I546_5421 [Mycobacterium kansasii 732]|uniref:hypothetical protein n=1 Tax=Mycobacterium pseudokansasii TaxID=2341080 RepID=UPI000447D517|nr:hypothetical protein [Mycobacterium pseudokansasii]EUA06411.1 hypothetical protein I546_5421 [Mycobacterium kansasii 732]KZS69301.1 hypothetical protein A4G27_00940 [Mycobacterium kansasii]MBY0391238.1 hypothetical protein [Mycobacterium pseudokansasii]